MTVAAQALAPARSRTVPDAPGSPQTDSAASGRARTVSDAQAVKPAPPAALSRPRRAVPLAPMRQAAAKSMTALAGQVMRSHPDSIAHEHVRDAARMIQAGNEEAAQRHLRAAAHALTPQSLHRRGVHDDDGHIAGAQAIDGLNRHVLLVKDIADVAAQNQAAIERDSYGDDATAPPRKDPNAGYGPGALAQKPTARQPPGDQALNAPNRTSAGRPDPNVASPDSPQPGGSKQFAYGWDDVSRTAARVIEMSARTAMLEATPAPYGVPGGPGLYGVKNNKHSDYFEAIVQALMHERGMDKARASRIAWGAIRRWSAGKGRVHPEVRAASAGALGQEATAQARAHAHSVTWDDLAGVVVELAVVDVKTYQRTVNTKNGPVRQTIVTHDQNYRNGTGQPAGGGGSSGGAQQGQQNGKAPYQQLPSRAAEKARLLATARSYRQRAALLGVEVAAMNSALYNALYGSNTTKAQTGSTTAAQTGSTTAAQKGSTTTATTAATTAAQAAGTTATTATTAAAAAPATASTTPASTGTTAAQAGATTAAQTGSTTAATAGSTTKAAAPTPSAAAQAATAALGAGATQAQVTQAQAQATKAAAGMSVPQLRTAIGQLQARISWYNTQASALTAQAAKLP